MGVIITTPTQSALSLPVWTFDPAQTGTPAAGHFQSDNTNPSAVGNIYINAMLGGVDWSAFFNNHSNGWFIITDATGKSSVYSINTASLQSGVMVYNVTVVAAGSAQFSGSCAFQFNALTAPFGLSQVLTASGITPAPDGTTTPVTSVTLQGGIPTAIS